MVEAKHKRNRIDMAQDLSSGRAVMVTDVDTEFGKPEGKPVEEAPAPVKVPDVPVVKASDKKTTTTLGDAVIEEIEVEKSPDIEAGIPGVVIVEDDDFEPVFDERDNEIPQEDVVIVNNLHDIDEDDILATNRAISVVGDDRKEEKVAEEAPEVEESVEIPSKTALGKMNKPSVCDVADSLDIVYSEDDTKKKIIEKILKKK